MSCDDPILQIVPTPPQRRPEALQLLYGSQEPDERRSQIAAVREAADRSPPLWRGLLGAFLGDNLVGVAWWQPHPGRTAAVAVPAVTTDAPADTADRLLERVTSALDEHSVCLAQALVTSVGADDEARLRRWGFDRLADLFYLVSLAAGFPAQPPVDPLQYEIYCDENHRRLAKIVEDSYRQTLDCPALNGLREIDDVLEGYRATGRFDPRHWLIARQQGNDVGCLLLAEHPQSENMELVYMGVMPAHRGRKIGLHLTRRAQWLARTAGSARLVLAVDADNRPALAAYAAAGFEAWDRRTVFVRAAARKTAR